MRLLDLRTEQLLIPTEKNARLQLLVGGIVEKSLTLEALDQPRPTVQCNLREQTQTLLLGPPRSSLDQTCHKPGELSRMKKRALLRFAECNRRAPSHDGSV